MPKTYKILGFSKHTANTGHAAFSVWNSLPREIRHIQSTTAFTNALKTRLFKSYLC